MYMYIYVGNIFQRMVVVCHVILWTNNEEGRGRPCSRVGSVRKRCQIGRRRAWNNAHMDFMSQIRV
jgi:hypothetical protein